MIMLNIRVSDLNASVVNPRFDMTEIEELADSIKAHGILEPLVVEHTMQDDYVVLAGHRRLAAARSLGIKEVACVVRDEAELKADHTAVHLVENIQRVNLSPMETALGVARMIEGKKSQKAISKELGRSPTWVSKFAACAKAYAKLEKAEEGSGAYMVKMTDADKLYAEARKVLGLDKKEVQDELTLNEDTEEEVSENEKGEIAVIRELEDLVQNWLCDKGVKFGVLKIEPHGKSGFEVRLTYKSEKDLRASFPAWTPQQ